MHSQLRSTWAAIGAVVAITLGAGGIGISHATTSSGEKPVYLPIEPCRLADTRTEFQVGDRGTPLGPDETYTLGGHGAVGNCSLPGGTTALSLNVTAVDATAPTFLSLFPAGASVPVASHLNPLPGDGPVPNAVDVDLDGSGEFSIYNLAGTVDIIIDVVGVYDDHTHDDRYYTEAEIDSRRHAEARSVTFDETLTTAFGPIEFTAPAAGTLIIDLSCRVAFDDPTIRVTFTRTSIFSTSASTYLDASSPSVPTYFTRYGYDLAAGDTATYTVQISNETDATDQTCRMVATLEFIPDA